MTDNMFFFVFKGYFFKKEHPDELNIQNINKLVGINKQIRILLEKSFIKKAA